jgi:hypothetical protein
MKSASSPRQTWTLERVVAEIRALKVAGELGSSYDLEQRGHVDLVAAAKRYAGSWAKAMRLAGFDYVPRRSWTEASVLREIRRLHRRGKSLHATRVENSLLLAAKRRFGSWRKARAAALPSYDEPYERWTRRRVLNDLAALHARGFSLSANKVKAMGQHRLVSAAIRLFGSWDKARRRAVADFTPLLQSWTKRRVVRAIRARHADGHSLSSTRVVKEDLPLAGAAVRYFGTWRAARTAAGVPYHDPRHTWPADRVVAELRRHAPDGIQPTCTSVGQALYKVAIARFGSFHGACRAAGLRPRC